MSILTGFKRFKKFIKTDDGYMPSYDKTIASAVCFGDGTNDTDTVESRLSGIKGITTSNSVTKTGYAADASVVSKISNDITEIQDNIDTLNSSLANLKIRAETLLCTIGENGTIIIDLSELNATEGYVVASVLGTDLVVTTRAIFKDNCINCVIRKINSGDYVSEGTVYVSYILFYK